MRWPNIVVQQICDKNQTKGSVSDRDTKMSRKVAEMILFEISYGPKLNKSKMAVIFKMAAKFEKNPQNYGQNGGIQDGRYFQVGDQFNKK